MSSDLRQVTRPGVVEAWQDLLRRTYLDTSTLQAIFDHGGTVFEDEPNSPSARASRVNEREDDVEALRLILLINERTHFDSS